MQKRLIAGYLLFICSTNCARAEDRTANQRTYVHVTVNARRLSGAPISNLRVTDFALTASGTAVYAAFSRYPANHPTFVLLIVAPSSGYTSLPAIRAMLASHLPREDRSAYLFAMLGPKGEYLPFRPRTNLVAELFSQNIVYKGYLQAIRDLATCKGRRAILYITNRLSNPPADLIAGAKDAGAMIYEVGGDPRQNFIDDTGSFSTFQPHNASHSTSSDPISPGGTDASNPGNAVTWESYAVKDVRSVYVVSSIGNAFDELLHDLKGFYETQIVIPAQTQTLTLVPKIKGEYQVNAFLYSESAEPVPALIVTK